MTDTLLYRLRGVMCGDDPVIEEAASRIEELEKYQSIHAQCDKSSLEVEGKLVQRLGSAHTRIEKLEAALDDALQYVSRADWHYLKDETRKALEGKDD